MRTIVLASNNKHKIKEFKEMYKKAKILSLNDIGYKEEIEENGETFLENAIIKAKTIHEYLKNKNIEACVIADDSGLCVPSLNGDPGVYSARYAGMHGNNVANRKKLLENLSQSNNREAYFVCVLVKYLPNGDYIYSEGRTNGYILTEERGDTSFGYDCIFYSNELKKSFGEATDEEKNQVSHRGRAISKLLNLEEKLNINSNIMNK